ncbi:MAG: hypothetical protein GY847_06235 [Proteobacteria bacterium]|nr:hypothetical protein [Pseudomonadota bacterium]
MTKIDHPFIEPRANRFKFFVTKLCLYFLGMAVQTGYRINKEMKREIDEWPATFTFLLSIIGGPSMVIQKKNGKVRWLGGKELFYADIECCFKNLEFGYMAMIGNLSTLEATCHNRQFIKGDLSRMMSVVRILNTAQWLIFPNFLLKRYVKKVPGFSLAGVWQMMVVYFNIGAGLIK